MKKDGYFHSISATDPSVVDAFRVLLGVRVIFDRGEVARLGSM